METLKILMFEWRCWFNPEKGGAETFTYENANRWAKAGHEVTLLTSGSQNCKRLDVVERVKIIRAWRKYSVYWKIKKYHSEWFSKEEVAKH